MIESRCGILCNECHYKEEIGCLGCVHIKKPFWGEECIIKSCCEKKGHEYCGECEAFPCDQLNAFAYDEKQGDDGKRIHQCKMWKECQK